LGPGPLREHLGSNADFAISSLNFSTAKITRIGVAF
jgi:hypothetical protein